MRRVGSGLSPHLLFTPLNFGVNGFIETTNYSYGKIRYKIKEMDD